jgi:pimeloyl-ACP methyl ester carboxylesterase
LGTGVVKREITVDGLRIQYLMAGSTGSPVVLLHGGGIDAASLTYRYLIDPLARDHVVYAPDLPGYGGSDKPNVAYTTEYFVRFLGRFLNTLDLDRACLVGLSLGGGIALGFTLESPDRVHRLVLADSFGLGGDVPWPLLAFLLVRVPLVSEATWALTARSRWIIRWMLEQYVFADPRSVTDDLVDEVRQLLNKPGAGAAFRSLQREEISRSGLRTNFSDRLDAVNAPTLIVHGEADRLVPVAWARRAHERIPNSTLEIIPNCGHWPPHERPDDFNHLVITYLASE